ncbi:response regulator [Labrys monachus]|uniref:DNA-binding response OmpR family regulator n=1 Tax=Labrys monachus TaxID=217067 RepID=A0ABU0FNX5_9HYPH|nr:response regulator [Labrys monachus]MDQ0395730.1 DNA-binding response OmpR family regulator [Labrys monachus]
MNLQRGTAGVLLVEDELLIACLMEDMLRELGFRNIHIASSLMQAVELLVSRVVDLGILDVNVGKDLVFPLACELKTRKVPIVFATGRAPSDLPPEWTTCPVLPKPVDMAVLTRTIGAFGF